MCVCASARACVRAGGSLQEGGVRERVRRMERKREGEKAGQLREKEKEKDFAASTSTEEGEDLARTRTHTSDRNVLLNTSMPSSFQSLGKYTPSQKLRLFVHGSRIDERR